MPSPTPPDAAPPPAAQPAGTAPLTDCVVVPRFIARAAARGRAEAESLVRAAGTPDVLGAPDTARTPSAGTFRLWREVLQHTGRSDAGLLVAGEYRHGSFDLFDYLLSTAPTLGDGLALAAAHVHLVSSSSVFVTEESDDEVTVAYEILRPDDELRGVVAEFVLAALTRHLRHDTGRALSPTRVSFAHRAPRRTTAYADCFGDAAVDFGAPADSITLHRSDLALPMATADPALAAIIQRTAAAFPPPRQDPADPVPGLRAAILAQLADGRPSLAGASRRLAVSRRTLQRRLAETGTTWRAELDTVRRERSAGLLGTGSAQRTAAQLGFSETRSLRRAMNRWDTLDTDRAAGPARRPGREAVAP
ncbi:AraC family transcriptional regulator ligand-binding domain-containing protein [Streptomyces cocklensis]|jgi:AraC-like DNA-binding protein|uniref:Transcriptional regulator, AraC family n=1 Tax=Actinacidiphila cocklensis TaxID=887465 RepID=A0A9W4GTB8_9ACTN|nr:AraC family transcriptional regulator ligand-binding domain-containing protein [Actinacidiphila cocklensis]MDD1059215.1 AraC family transcriptional regulator ligand-binding domain-containing protein [Actinacidiphila cocklensis]CAG6396851.1 Transcriptional regulator, AraC family [Actinacidiphila cocklensis]